MAGGPQESSLPHNKENPGPKCPWLKMQIFVDNINEVAARDVTAHFKVTAQLLILKFEPCIIILGSNESLANF